MVNEAAFMLYVPLMASVCFVWARRAKPGVERARMFLPIAVLNIAMVIHALSVPFPAGRSVLIVQLPDRCVTHISD